MDNLLPELLPLLKTHRLPGIELGEKSVYPCYDGYSLPNLPSSVCHWLGAPPFGAQPLDKALLDRFGGPFKHVVLILVDGLGLNWFQRVSRTFPGLAELWPDLLEDARLAALTSVVPSTTATALTTLWTGRTPAEHGVMGYEMWLKEYGVVANMIFHAPMSFGYDFGTLSKAGFDPSNFLPVDTLGPHLVQNNVQVYAFQHRAIAFSGLSKMILKGAEIVPWRTLEDQWYLLGKMLDEQKTESTYAYVYWSVLDELSHVYGADDTRVAREFLSFSRSLRDAMQQMQKNGRGDTLVLMTADHGHLLTPRDPRYELRHHPELLDYLTILPTGENRLPYLFVRPGCGERAGQYIEAHWPGSFKLVPSVTALQARLFGNGTACDNILDRIGDFVVIPQDESYWWWSAKANPLLGRHGGLSEMEMLVPLVGWVV